MPFPPRLTPTISRFVLTALVAAELAGTASGATAPSAADDVVTVASGVETTIDVLANDTAAVGPLSVIATSTPAHGRVVLGNGRLRYRPDPGYTGADAFTYTLRDATRIGAVARAPLAAFGSGASAATVFGSGFGSAIAPVPGSATDFYIMTDRGPNVGGTGSNKVFPVPSFAPQIARVAPDASTGGYRVVSILTLKRPAAAGDNAYAARTLTGLPNTFNPTTGIAVAVGGAAIAPGTDDYGFDSEGLVALADGTFWASDEYGPYIAHFDAAGVELERIAPSSLDISTLTDHSTHTLPAVLAKRFENKGMEGLTITPDGTKLVGIMQSPLDNLTTGAADVKKGVANRIVVYDLATGTTQQYLYLLERTSGGSPNTTVSEIAAISNRKFLIDERDSKFPNDPADAATFKRIYEIDLDGDPALGGARVPATDVSDSGDAAIGRTYTAGKTIEDLAYNKTTAAASTALVAEGVQPAFKRVVVDLLAVGNAYAYDHDKIEGLAVLSTATDPVYGTVAAKIAISNDDDFGVTDASPAADTPAVKSTPQGAKDYNEILTLDLSKGGPGVSGFPTDVATATATVTLTVAATSPYLVQTATGVVTRTIATVGDSVNLKPDGATPYRFAGIPDGLGAFDNGDGTFTLLMNHELSGGVPGTSAPKGAPRAHGSAGAFVSRWVIDKATLAVRSIADEIPDAAHLFTWNGTAYVAGTTVFSRFCSADLAAASAYLNGGKGTAARIFLNGEEDAPFSRSWAHVATGADARTSYQLPRFGRFESENAVACPKAQDKTVVMMQNDNGLSGAGAGQGQVFCYIGAKQTTGTGPLAIDDAGLTNGKLYGIAVTGFLLEDRANPFGGVAKGGSKPFTLGQLGTGDASAYDEAATMAAADAAGVTRFLRPEDGAWDPTHPADYYFVTTDRIDNLKNGGDGTGGTTVGRSRLWRLRFTDITAPESGGTVTLLIDGSEDPGPQMMDNITVDGAGGRVLIDEDPGNFVGSAKMWVYSIGSGTLTAVAKHDPARFGDRAGSPLANTAATAPFTTDEESSGVLDVGSILGTGWFLAVSQAHYTNADAELVEGGQLQALYIPSSIGGGTATVAGALPSPSASTPYLVPTDASTSFGAIATVGETFNLKPDGVTPYRFVGIPDGLGAFDNGDGTFTLLMNHELSGGVPGSVAPKGIARAHGSAGAFVSRWTISKTTLQVQSIADEIPDAAHLFAWNGTAYAAGTTVFSRFCSADLAAATAYLNGGKGTTARLFLNGEEDVNFGRSWAHVASGPDQGKSYQLARFGRVESENAVACPKAQDKTVVMMQNDNGLSGTGTGQGQVFCYVGAKQTTGTGPLDIDDAGLTNGLLYGVAVTGFALEDRASPFGGVVKGGSKPFTLGRLGSGDASGFDSAATQAASDAAGVTRFLRPEDGAWDPTHPADYYFLTTDRIDNAKNGGDGTGGTTVGRSRLWRLRFADIGAPEGGGTITLLIDGSEDPGPQMMDNLTIDAAGGRVVIDEDPGNFVGSAKMWVYAIGAGTLTAVAKHDPARFGERAGSPLANTAATAPFTTDEESSGVLDVSGILGANTFLVVCQAHYTNPDAELVEGGQLLAMRVVPPVVTPPIGGGGGTGASAGNDDDDSKCGSGSGIALLGLGLALMLACRFIGRRR